MSTSLPQLAPRDPESHKGDYGRLLLIGGSRGMSGAIALAGLAAVRSGAGLVRLATPDVSLDAVAAQFPAYMTLALPSDRHGRIARTAWDALHRAIEQVNVVAIGPGLGRSLGLGWLVDRLYREVALPMVVDADALNALADRGTPLAEHSGPRILTPHSGEFRRLVPNSSNDRAEQESQAIELARSAGIVLVLKGHHTLVTDGKMSFHNTTGNPGMATGGSGDVLTGVITALLGQGLTPLDAARLGVYLHGAAGDIAADVYGEVSLTPLDIVESLSITIQNVSLPDDPV
ncbi:MAG: NAD(P)H-hydrate dehydratase [Planctomycetia bacterium]|nr:NAD(P)H-hydrate dehydratase [Planctomycetia bacterium]